MEEHSVSCLVSVLLFQDEVVLEICLPCCRTLQSRLKMGRTKPVQVKPVFISEVILELGSELAPLWVFTACIYL